MFAEVASRGRGAGRAFGAPEVGVPWSEGSVPEPGGKRAWTWLTVRFGGEGEPGRIHSTFFPQCCAGGDVIVTQC